MSNAIFNLSADSRSLVGKGASRRLRRENKVPAIVYGGEQQPEKITLGANDVLKATRHEAFFSHILTLTVDGKAEKVIIKDLQRHPARDIIYHMDFLRVSAKEAITMAVPLHYLGEEDAPGVKQGGGFVSREITEVEIKCLPADLPSFIEVDISSLELDSTLHMSHINLPKGVELATPIEDGEHDLAIVGVHSPRTAVEPETNEAPEAKEVPSEKGGDAADESNAAK